MRTPIYALSALTAILGFAAQVSFAQEVTSDEWTKAQPSKARAEVRAELDAARAAGELSIPSEYGIHDRPFVSTLTRAEVGADLQLFRESGLADLHRGEATPFYSEEYRRAEARYAELRLSPRYAELVQRLTNGARVASR
jgi:hypothetical protein